MTRSIDSRMEKSFSCFCSGAEDIPDIIYPLERPGPGWFRARSGASLLYQKTLPIIRFFVIVAVGRRFRDDTGGGNLITVPEVHQPDS